MLAAGGRAGLRGPAPRGAGGAGGRPGARSGPARRAAAGRGAERGAVGQGARRRPGAAWLPALPAAAAQAGDAAVRAHGVQALRGVGARAADRAPCQRGAERPAGEVLPGRVPALQAGRPGMESAAPVAARGRATPVRPGPGAG